MNNDLGPRTHRPELGLHCERLRGLPGEVTHISIAAQGSTPPIPHSTYGTGAVGWSNPSDRCPTHRHLCDFLLFASLWSCWDL